MWDLDSLGIKKIDEVHEAFIDSITFDGERYSVRLPWKKGHGDLPSNYENNLSRMKEQIRRLKKEPELLAGYDAIIREQLQKGIIEKVPALDTAESVHYLPHQAVVRKDAKTTKLRIVYNASSKESKSGLSLNDCLHKGPSLNSLLMDILLRFRESRVSLCADIEKAFLQISVDPPDRDFLRFLWVDNIHGEYKVDVYRFSRVVFGVNASPFLLNGTIRHHLSSFAIEDPSFVQKMINDFYVDDLITGENTVGDAYTLYEKARDRMACGGFRLRKWLTNDAVLRAKIQLAEKEVNVDTSSLHKVETFAKTSLAPYSQGENSKAERVLGLPWDCESDTIHFVFERTAERANEKEPTKRNVPSTIAGMFDPLGIISPVSVSMKILFQELCVKGDDWDQQLLGDTKVRWEKWLEDLFKAKEISIARCVYSHSLECVTGCYLHGFGDASKKAYCAVVYMVYQLTDGSRHVRLLTGKTRVAPLKQLTIPRLELMSATILTTLVETVQNALSPQVEVSGMTSWLDSKTALYWIRNAGEWKQFVRHRVNSILECTQKKDWRYCPTETNPADIGSRGAFATVLKSDSLWWEGPPWLAGPESGWPPRLDEMERTPETQEEERKPVTTLVAKAVQGGSIANVVDLSRHCRFHKVVRVTAWVSRFVNNARSQVKDETSGRWL